MMNLGEVVFILTKLFVKDGIVSLDFLEFGELSFITIIFT